MKDLKERLRRLDPAPARPRRRPRQAESELLERLEGFQPLPGGALRRVLPLEGLPSPSALSPESWRLLAGVERRPRLPWVVFDCETTGLESGAGNLVFLIGWVEWKTRGSRCVQIFLPEPSSEAEMLEAFEAAVGQAGALLSYNGKSFDLPRLRSRLALQRRAFAAEELPHMDLLHPCRRLSRDWLADGRLGTMERAFLGKERRDDLPGSEVPGVYRDFLAGDVAAPIERVIEHNLRDVERLCELAAVLAGLGRGDASLPPSARLQLARLHEARGNVVEARARYDELATGEDAAAGRALWWGGLLEKRRKDHAAARMKFEEFLRRQPSSVEARVELAKLLEHRFADAFAARRLVLEALDAVERADLLGTRREGARSGLRRRLMRLERKCAARK